MSMTQFTLRIPNETLKNIKGLASEEGSTLTDYILSKADPSYSENQNILQVTNILNKLDSVPDGENFSLRSLYEQDQWVEFSIGSRIATGRLFFQCYKNNSYNLQNRIEFIGKNAANLAEYKKLKNE